MWLLLKCPVFIQAVMRLRLVSLTPQLLPNLCENGIIKSKIYSVTWWVELKLIEHYQSGSSSTRILWINVLIFKQEHDNQMAKIVKVLNANWNELGLKTEFRQHFNTFLLLSRHGTKLINKASRSPWQSKTTDRCQVSR